MTWKSNKWIRGSQSRKNPGGHLPHPPLYECRWNHLSVWWASLFSELHENVLFSWTPTSSSDNYVIIRFSPFWAKIFISVILISLALVLLTHCPNMPNLSSTRQHLKYSEIALTSSLPVPFQSKRSVFFHYSHHQNFHILNSADHSSVDKVHLEDISSLKNTITCFMFTVSYYLNRNKMNC